MLLEEQAHADGVFLIGHRLKTEPGPRPCT